ncbi:hypothetical protein RFI_09965 [Reticulomyxa filosa]|uniref:Uncharacterized protein n=1 Tax=Reticulomyxa filosa TaxID=46433 RepID=X6NLK2_RETFI|nr:hypothetical protein RFI_09965 [Reticulomyxa filosa]|eukprot:ETO27165.1 hypothetical protein RFI_09965 [Reticulomyxa filosa]
MSKDLVHLVDVVNDSKTKKQIPRTITGINKSAFFHEHIERDEKGFYYHIRYSKTQQAPKVTKCQKKKVGYDKKRRKNSIEELANNDLAKLPNFGSQDSSFQEANRRLVFWECKMKRISDINTTQETFRCRFHYYLTWLATKEEVRDYENFIKFHKNTTDTVFWYPHWVPRLEFTNAVEVIQFEEHSPKYEVRNATNQAQLRESWKKNAQKYIELLGFDPSHGQWIRCRYEADVVFAEEMELENFPFDVCFVLSNDHHQKKKKKIEKVNNDNKNDNNNDFTAYFKAELETTACRLLPFPRDRIFCSLDGQFSVLSEWILKRVVIEFKQTDKTRSRGTRTYSIVAIHIKASRKWNTRAGEILLTFCMMTMGLGAFAMDTSSDNLGNRLIFAITLLLADVTSLQLLIQQLPNIPYWTEMVLCVFFLSVYAGNVQ